MIVLELKGLRVVLVDIDVELGLFRNRTTCFVVLELVVVKRNRTKALSFYTIYNILLLIVRAEYNWPYSSISLALSSFFLSTNPLYTPEFVRAVPVAPKPSFRRYPNSFVEVKRLSSQTSYGDSIGRFGSSRNRKGTTAAVLF